MDGLVLPGGDGPPSVRPPAAVSDRSDREVLFARNGDAMVYKVWDAAPAAGIPWVNPSARSLYPRRPLRRPLHPPRYQAS